MKRSSKIEWVINCDVAKIWAVVTNNTDYRWRTDLKEIQTLSETEFIEVSSDGTQTAFRITKKVEHQEYCFAMNNKLFSGEWIGKFTPMPDGFTKLDFIEQIEIANPLIYILSFPMLNLKKFQRSYMTDLEKKLVDEQ
ncbi:hypothetical protein [Enterococcus sp. HY326]|uniref:hypothetical protein n=1 Tax=Enterococcus sp. HY326 TaxID=2971265 RepID=UPI00223F0842|nr:hypothetical protein [Enterococcus sp. HY326]